MSNHDTGAQSTEEDNLQDGLCELQGMAAVSAWGPHLAQALASSRQPA